MKHFLLFCLIGILTVSELYAEEPYPFSIGLSAMPRISMYNATSPADETHGMAFSGVPDIGLSIYIPASRRERVGITMDIAYATYKNSYTKSSVDFARTFNYLTITPGLSYSFFTVGIAVGLPIGYQRKNITSGAVEEEGWSVIKSGSNPPEKITKYGNGKDNMSLLIEPRVGICYPVMSNNGSRLNVNANIGLMMNNLYKDEYYPTTNLQQFNASMMSFALGVQYMFGL